MDSWFATLWEQEISFTWKLKNMNKQCYLNYYSKETVELCKNEQESKAILVLLFYVHFVFEWHIKTLNKY